MDTITVIVPCYNEEAVLPAYFAAMHDLADRLAPAAELALLMVDDGSRDGTLALLRREAAADSRVSFLSFSRNFGKEAAMLAGLEHARGDYVAVMDADLQDPPAMLEEMYRILRTGEADCVAARRETRAEEPPLRSFFARLFYRLINRISGTEVVDGARDFRLMTRRMTDAILTLPERCRFSKGLFSWVGFTTVWLPYENVARAAGTTKWSFFGLFRYALDGILAFSAVPLVLPLLAAALCGVVSAVLLVLLLVQGAAGGACAPLALAFTVVSLSALILAALGVLGGYLAKLYWEIKGRPVYLIREASRPRE